MERVWSERERERDPTVERPWYGLVTWVYENWRRQGGVLVFRLLLSFFCHRKDEAFVFNASVLAIFFSLSLASWDRKKRDPGKEVDHCWDSSVVWHLVHCHLLPRFRFATEDMLTLTVDERLFYAFIFYGSILLLKTFFMALLISRQRLKNGVS